jgi:hypothetical protein
MLRSYPILCTRKGCKRLAVYKIAARWSDGATEELKTYALCCAECLTEAYRGSFEKNRACRRAREEILEPPGVYLLARGQRDPELQRCPELEVQVQEANRGAL